MDRKRRRGIRQGGRKAKIRVEPVAFMGILILGFFSDRKKLGILKILQEIKNLEKTKFKSPLSPEEP